MNDFRYYQDQAGKTVVGGIQHATPKDQVSYYALGLTNEAGEVAGKVKKYLRGDKDAATLREEVRDELGDVLWYLAMVAKIMDLDLGEVAASNINKLHDRKARGTLQGDGDNR